MSHVSIVGAPLCSNRVTGLAMNTSQRRDIPNPYDSSNTVSRWFYIWILPLFKKGWRTSLELGDIYDPIRMDQSETLGDSLALNWEEELKQHKKKSSHSISLIRCLVKTFYNELLSLGVLVILALTSSIGQSFLLGKLLLHFRPVPLLGREDAMMYACGMVLCTFVSVMCNNQYTMLAYHTGSRIRAACCAVIYRKSIRLSNGALGETTSGQIVNLLANDVSRFDIMCMFPHYMWAAPLLTAIVAALFWTDGGPPALLGFSVLIFVTAAQSLIGRLSAKFRRLTALKTDKRVRLVNEVISGIQVIKMYAWEKSFISLMKSARKQELSQLRKLSVVRAVFMIFHMCTTRMSLFVSVLGLAVFGSQVSSDKVFVFQSYYNVLQWTVTVMFVRGWAELSESYTSIQRIQKFLLSKEFHPRESHQMRTKKSCEWSNVPQSTGTQTNENAGSSIEIFLEDSWKQDYCLALENVTAKWDSTQSTLNSINLRVLKGQLSAIIGPVAAGKSSVLQAILGELVPSGGDVYVSGEISYAAQDAWIFPASVRQNVLFGSKYDIMRYEKVVKACALFKDFKQLPNGDMTEVGERGVSLSGGQKARINMARALYREADIYLLDDPLSAVDTHVGQHLFYEAIKGFLREKTVVLVTHQLQYLRNADVILLMENGCSVSVGTFEDVVNSGSNYAKLLTSDDGKSSAPSDMESYDCHQPFVPRSPTKQKLSVSSCSVSVHSVASAKSNDNEEQTQNNTNLVVGAGTLETSSKGTVKGSVYVNYCKASGSIVLLFLLLFLFLATQLAASGADYWVAYWSKVEDNRYELLQKVLNLSEHNELHHNPFEGKTNQSTLDTTIPSLNLSTDMCAYIYTSIIFATIFLCIIRTTLYYYVVLQISRRLHDSMFCSLVRTAMKFYDINPSGRILNRFTKDMGSVDELLPKIILDACQVMLYLVGAVVLTVVGNYLLMFPFLILLVLFYFIQIYYLKTSKEIKRLEGMTRSPVFSHMNISLQGMVTIRAFGAQQLLIKEFDKHQNLHSGTWFLQQAGSSAFSMILELTSVCYNVIVLICIFAFNSSSSGGEVGLIITQSMTLLNTLQWGIRVATEVANNMMSAERILEYTQLPPEDKNFCEGKTSVRDWPSNGSIKLSHVYLRYSCDDHPVLHDLNLEIEGGEKIGIVGRTGAGKSSLIAVLFKMASIEGKVIIDNIDTSDVTLQQLRSAISIIPQDPVLFSGSIRHNLDPFDEYSDDRLWEALEEVELRDVFLEQQGLQTRVTERGGNFSVGQRQLVCLARAILRANKILVMDEATANVDPQTDKLIQSTIRTKFNECTMLSIAHRLNTVIDCDRVMVVDNGEVIEFNHPWTLLEKNDSVFKEMINQLEGPLIEQLRSSAKQNYDRLHLPSST